MVVPPSRVPAHQARFAGVRTDQRQYSTRSTPRSTRVCTAALSCTTSQLRKAGPSFSKQGSGTTRAVCRTEACALPLGSSQLHAHTRGQSVPTQARFAGVRNTSRVRPANYARPIFSEAGIAPAIFRTRTQQRRLESAERARADVLNLRTTTTQKCEAVPRRARI